MNVKYIFRLSFSFLLVMVLLAVSYFFSSAGYEAAMAPDSKARPTLILDPGHGGEDGGAVSVTGKKESGINLEIALRCRDLASFLGYSAVMTRESENIDYPPDLTSTRARKVWDQKSRVQLINSASDGLLISIHQNKYTSPGPKGAQVFYNEGAGELAEAVQKSVLRYINDDTKRTARPVSKDIYIMNEVSCPALLVECGFLSNPEEAARLESQEHQKKLALIIIGQVKAFYG